MTTNLSTLLPRAHANGMVDGPPDPEVPAKAKRRRFALAYKLAILQEADALEGGEVGALLRREGLYYSHLVDWRNQRAKGTLGFAKTGRPATDPKDSQIQSLRAENEKLRRRVEHAEAVIDVQKKLSVLLGIESEMTKQGGKR